MIKFFVCSRCGGDHSLLLCREPPEHMCPICGEDHAACPEPAKAEHQKRIQNVVDAIEAFVQAKINYAQYTIAPVPSSVKIDVSETREHLLDKLAELVSK